MTTASAPGKIILFGEHAVVYGRPAIAAPVAQVQATAKVRADAGAPRAEVTIEARDLDRQVRLSEAADDEPLADIVRRTLAHLGQPSLEVGLVVEVRSSIPIASGLGSGAAISTAVARALAAHFARPLDEAEVASLVYETEKLYHGAPSGIDNTVVAFGRPVYFVKGKPPETFRVAEAFRIAIADTGVASPTRIAVGGVRERWQADGGRYEFLFDRIGEVSVRARAAIESGETASLGGLMNENQEWLREIGVSSPELERLIAAACAAGAPGAKLSGAGMGGNMIALVDDQCEAAVVSALHEAGAEGVIVTNVRPHLP